MCTSQKASHGTQGQLPEDVDEPSHTWQPLRTLRLAMSSGASGRNSRHSWLHRVGKTVTHLALRARRRPSPRVERILLSISFVVFVGTAITAAWNLPSLDPQIRWGLLGAAALITPANVVLNAVEFQVIARFVSQRIPLRRAIRITVLGSAANLLPIPGSTLVRVHALATGRATYRSAIGASVAVGVMSVGANLLLAGTVLIKQASFGVVAALLGAGILTTAAGLGVISLGTGQRHNHRFAATAFGVELLYASVSAVRLWMILLGLGTDVELASAFALTAAGALATAVGFFPGGLGLRELLVGTVSPLVGLSITAGLSGAVLQRLFGLTVLALAAGTILLRTRSRLSKADCDTFSQSSAQPKKPRRPRGFL